MRLIEVTALGVIINHKDTKSTKAMSEPGAVAMGSRLNRCFAKGTGVIVEVVALHL